MRPSYEVDEESNSTFLTNAQPYFDDERMLESPWLAKMDMDSPRQVEKAKFIGELENVPGQTDLPHKYVPVLMLVWQAQEQVDLTGQSRACSSSRYRIASAVSLNG